MRRVHWLTLGEMRVPMPAAGLARRMMGSTGSRMTFHRDVLMRAMTSPSIGLGEAPLPWISYATLDRDGEGAALRSLPPGDLPPLPSVPTRGRRR